MSVREDNVRAADHVTADLFPACPRCGDLSATTATVCETCGKRLTEDAEKK